MKEFEAVNNKKKKLVQNSDPLSLDLILDKGTRTKKQLRRIVLPRLKKHVVNGSNYYTFCQGSEPEIYVGSPELVLRAVTFYKQVGSNPELALKALAFYKEHHREV